MGAASESRAEAVARELLTIRGWRVQRPPKGNVLWKNEYRDYLQLAEAFLGKGKTGRGGDAYPDFLVVDRATIRPIIVGETKARDRDLNQAISEACDPYGDALDDKGFRVLAAGVAGDDQSNIAVQIRKRSRKGWQPVQYRQEPIQWIPTPQEAELLIADADLFELQPRVPSNEILAQRGDEINRILRECKIKDEFRPAIIGAFMLGLWNSKGDIRIEQQHILDDINSECRKAFIRAGKGEIAASINVPEANQALAAKARRICHILRLLNITTLTAEHDYLGQLYEMFFRFTGGNTIGQFFTPRHITRFMVDLVDVSKRDVVVDPTCGTGGFLVSALQRMTAGKPLTHGEINSIVRDHLKGFESEPITAALCVANMILRGDGTTGVVKGDCFTDDAFPEGEATVVVGNPPFPHKKTDEPAEKYIERGLEALKTRGNLAMITPASLLADSKKRKWREKILKENSLLGVFTLPSELFQPYAASTTTILLLKRGIPHSTSTRTFFCRISNDGYRLRKGTRVEQPDGQLPTALEAYQTSSSVPGFCITSTIAPTEKEWAPGAYIEFVDHPAGAVTAQAHRLIRNLTAFHATFAPDLDTLGALLSRGDVTPLPYDQIARHQPKHLDVRADRIGRLFDIYYGEQGLESKDRLGPGRFPVISSQGTDNGCYGFYEFDEDTAHLIQPPFVTVPRTGSIGEAFVQIWPCGVSSDCLLLIPRDGTDIDDLFVAASVIRLERWRFDYSRKITPERIAHMKIPRDKMLKRWIADHRTPVERLVPNLVKALADAPSQSPGISRKSPGPKPVILSMHPLTPEQALSAFMQVDPKKVLAAERKAKKKRRGH